MRDSRDLPISRTDSDSKTPFSELNTQRLSDYREHTQYISGLGETVISEGIVSKIATLAVREVPQVHEVDLPPSSNRLISRFSRDRDGGTAVRVKMNKREVSVQVRLAVDLGVSIPEIAESVRRCVVERVESMTGLTVKEVNLDITDLYLPPEDPLLIGSGDEDTAHD